MTDQTTWNFVKIEERENCSAVSARMTTEAPWVEIELLRDPGYANSFADDLEHDNAKRQEYIDIVQNPEAEAAFEPSQIEDAIMVDQADLEAEAAAMEQTAEPGEPQLPDGDQPVQHEPATPGINFDNMSMKELVAVQNEMATTAYDLGLVGSGYNPVKVFHTKATAVDACRKLHAAILKCREEKELEPGYVPTGQEPPVSPGLARLRGNKNAEAMREAVVADQKKALGEVKEKNMAQTAVAKKDDITNAKAPPKPVEGTKGTKRTKGIVGGQKLAAVKIEPAPRKDVEKVKGGPRLINTTNMRIELLHKGDNPRRGSAGERFTFYRTGMKVDTYIEKVGDRGLAMHDFRHDVKDGYIKLYEV